MTKIKTRTIEQVKKGMKCIINQDNGDCEDYYTCHCCPCFDPEHGSNEGVIEEGLEAIQQLEEDKKRLQERICNQRRQLRVLHAMYEWALGRLQKANLNDRAHFQAFLRERGYDLATMELPESPVVPLSLEEVFEKSKQLDCCVWVEYFDDGEDEPDLEPGLIVNFKRYMREGILYQITVRLGRQLIKGQHDYNLKWRCWLRRPTDEERQAAKWGGNHAD